MSPTRRLMLIALAVLLAGSALAWIQVRLRREPRPVGLVVLSLQEEGDGMVAVELTGLRACLEAGMAPSGRAVLRGERGTHGAGVEVLEARVSARKVAEFLQIQLELSAPGQRHQYLSFGPGDPGAVLQDALHQLGGRPEDLAHLMPRQRSHQWTVLEALAEGPQAEDLEGRCRRALEREPDAPLLWTSLGRCLSRRLTAPGPKDTVELLKELALTHQAAMQDASGNAWLAASQGLFQLEHGEGDLAMEDAFKALEASPWSLDLLDLLAHAARKAGLLEASMRVLRLQGQWMGKGHWQHGATDLVLAYRNDWGAFENGLRQCRPTPQTAFLRAFACLLRGRPEEAAPWLDMAARKTDFEGRLAGGLRLWVRGQRQEALGHYRSLFTDLKRQGCADGELVLRLAEAFALAESPDEAEAAATWAVDQGFLARPWYEESPFLTPLQARPSWKTLMDRIDDLHHERTRRHPDHRFGI